MQHKKCTDRLKRKVQVKILCRINIATLSNITLLVPLLTKYPEYIEIRHCFQPLRGFTVDNRIALFRYDEKASSYKEGELPSDLRILYEIYDKEWIGWLQKVFWNLFRNSIDYQLRVKQLNRIKMLK